MIAHVVFDLPLEGHFDYSIPKELQNKVTVGSAVKLTLGTKPVAGFVISTAQEAQVDKTIKPIKSVVGSGPVFDRRDLEFAKIFAAHYGCTLGEALGTMTRHRKRPPVEHPVHKTSVALYHCPDGQYLPVIEHLTKNREDYAIVVPDASVANGLKLPVAQRPFVGLRSSIFEAFTRAGLIIVIDEDNDSFKQEQSPMYDVRDTVLMAREVYGFDVCFIAATPSVELMHIIKTKSFEYTNVSSRLSKPSVIDLSNYKFLDKGFLSPPVRNALEANLKAKQKTVVILNRKGSYNVTRCKGCNHILRCPHCDSALVYSRQQKMFVCRHCSFKETGEVVCPQCKKANFESFGIGVEQLEKQLSQLLPQAKIAHFEKEDKVIPSGFDVLIATQAALRFEHRLNADTVVWVDFDAELNRADMRSSFKAWRLANHSRFLGRQLLVQSRNRDHHVLKALSADNPKMFYDAETALRKELDFSPFVHTVAVLIRARMEKSAQSFAQDVYNILSSGAPAGLSVSAATPALVAKVRDQYRFVVACQGKDINEIMAFIKARLASLKRKSKVIVTLNVNP